MQSCRKEFSYKKSEITSRMICTYAKVHDFFYYLSIIFISFCPFQNKDSCQGDSGGPVVWKNDSRLRYELVSLHFLNIVMIEYQSSLFVQGTSC